MSEAAERFIPGVYNYCDRWCERCAVSERCALRATVLGQFPIDSQACDAAGNGDVEQESDLGDGGTDFVGASGALGASAADQERTDSDDAGQVIVVPADPFYLDALSFGSDLHDLLVDVRAQRRAACRQQRPAAALDEACEVLAHYAWLPATKVDRALGNRYEALESPDSAAALRIDSDGSAKVAKIALTRLLEALAALSDLWTPASEAAMQLHARARALSETLDREFPGHRSFRRPGLDP